MSSAQGVRASHFDSIVAMVLGWIDRPYPCWLGHELQSASDAQPPAVLTPAFFGSYDWHSSVHSHWTLARLVRLFPDAPFVPAARAVLGRHLTADNLATEAAFLEARPGFERPYGLAWLLQLDAELAAAADPEARAWRAALGPLVQVAVRHLSWWLPRLTRPVRTGAHGQSAFAMGLVHDWAVETGAREVEALVRQRAIDLHGTDRDLALHLEPSGEDFLSPSLGPADLLRRVLSPPAFSSWLDRALPTLPRDGSSTWLPPATGIERDDGRLSHLDGLNLSRAWMLLGIARGLPQDDARAPSLRAAAAAHRVEALGPIERPYDIGAHWLGSFATYLLTERGLP